MRTHLNKTLLSFLSLVFIFMIIVCNHPLMAAETEKNSKPHTNVILVASGDFNPYQSILYETALALESFGLTTGNKLELPSDPIAVEPLWRQLSQRSPKNRLRFLPNGFYTFAWSNSKRQTALRLIKDRLQNKKDVDLILTVGTDTTREMAAMEKNIPIVALSTSNPVTSRIIISSEDSGQDNLHVMNEPDRFSRQFNMFHQIFGFTRVGIPLDSATADKSGLPDIQRAAKKLGVDLKVSYYKYNEKDWDDAFDRFMVSVRHLVEEEGLQALFIPNFLVPEKRASELSFYLIDHQVISFSSVVSRFVQNGLLLGLSESNLSEFGSFEANVIQQIIEGKKPRTINQVYHPQRNLVINLETAMRLGWHVPYDLLSSTHMVYKTIPNRVENKCTRPKNLNSKLTPVFDRNCS